MDFEHGFPSAPGALTSSIPYPDLAWRIAWEKNSARGQVANENCSFDAPKETNNSEQAFAPSTKPKSRSR
jgi:hypothetical protein